MTMNGRMNKGTTAFDICVESGMGNGHMGQDDRNMTCNRRQPATRMARGLQATGAGQTLISGIIMIILRLLRSLLEVPRHLVIFACEADYL